MTQMLHYNEICAALRGLVQSGVALTENAGGSDLVSVGSNRLFSPGRGVALTDDEGHREEHTVSEVVGLTQVRLDAPVSGEFLVENGAALRLNPPALADLKWIGQGLPEIMPQPPATHLPCLIVQPGRMEQPLAAGTNRAYQQDYRVRLCYLERPAAGEASGVEVLEKAGTLFDLLMADPYLGGAAWQMQVVAVEPQPQEVRRLREAGLEVIGVAIEVLARRLEMR